MGNALSERKRQGGLAVRISLDFLHTFSIDEKVWAGPAWGRKVEIEKNQKTNIALKFRHLQKLVIGNERETSQSYKI